MSKYAQNTTIGKTCPWSSGATTVRDAFTLAAQRAAARRQSKEITSDAATAAGPTGPAAVPQLKIPGVGEAKGAKGEVGTSRSTENLSTMRSEASRLSEASCASEKGLKPDMEAKMMEMIQKCVEAKVRELAPAAPAPAAPSPAASPVSEEVKSSRSTVSTKPGAPSHAETEASLKGLEMEPGPEAVTMAGRRAQAARLSDASLGQFDGDASRLAHLEMQKSAAEARNKNKSSICFDYAPSARLKKAAEAKEISMANKRAQGQKLSDASLGKFDADESRLAYLEMQRGAEEVRNKNRAAQCFGEKSEKPSAQYPALLQQAGPGGPGLSTAGKRAKAQKLSEAALGKFDADASMNAYTDMQKSAEQLRNKNRVGQGIF